MRCAIPSASVLVLLAAAPALAAAAPAHGPAMERHRTERPPLSLLKPAGWSVRTASDDQGVRVTVADPEEASRVELAFASNTARLDSPALLAATCRELRARHPDLVVSQASACRDGVSCAVATVTYTARSGAMRGRLYVHAGPGLTSVRRIVARADSFEAQRPLLLDVLTNIHLKTARAGADGRPAPLVTRRAPDGSVTIALPPDWTFQAQQGKALAVAPDAGSGFMFTVFQLQAPGLGLPGPPGTLLSPFRPPEQLIQVIWEHFGNREIQVVGASPDRETAAGCPRQIGRRCDAGDVQLRWVSPRGVACAGSFKLLEAVPGPTGQWFTIVAGIWGRSESLEEELPTLEAVAASFAIPDRYARGYVQQGLARLKTLQAKTQESVRGLYRSIEENQRDHERRSEERAAGEARWDDYRRGNSYWISDLEGGKVYATDPWGTRDTTTGDRVDGASHGYVHFEGQNPNHPSEQMREVSSHELQQLMEGRR